MASSTRTVKKGDGKRVGEPETLGSGQFSLPLSSSDGLFMIDAEQRIVYWNEAAQALLGYEPAEVLGRRCGEVLAGRDEKGCKVCQRSCQQIRRHQHGQLAPHSDLLVTTADGRPLWLHIVSLLVTLPSLEGPLILHICREASREKNAMHVLDSLLGLLREHVQDGSPHHLPISDASLTSREREVLALMAEGHGTEAIVERLYISRSTARKHIQSMLNKFGVHSRLEALAYATRHRLLS